MLSYQDLELVAGGQKSAPYRPLCETAEMPPPETQDKTIAEFLDTWPSEIKTISYAMREFILHHCPGVRETLHPGWKVISYGSKIKFCAIAPHTKWVNLQFHAGTSLEDPQARLEGTGKSIRHVKIKSIQMLDASLAALLKQAQERS